MLHTKCGRGDCPGRCTFARTGTFIIPHPTQFCQEKSCTNFTPIFSRNFVQHYYLLFAIGCGIILLSVGGMATEPPTKKFQKSLKKLLTNRTECDIIRLSIREWELYLKTPKKIQKSLKKVLTNQTKYYIICM